MANICDNTFYAQSEDENNLKYIEEFITNKFRYSDVYSDDDFVEAYFDSKWTFPEEVMHELYEGIPNKEDIFMRCLSVEYGNLYHALWVCDKEGWTEV